MQPNTFFIGRPWGFTKPAPKTRLAQVPTFAGATLFSALAMGCQSATPGSAPGSGSAGQAMAGGADAGAAMVADEAAVDSAATDWHAAPSVVDLATGQPVAITDLAADGQWTAIHFLLKTECPICLRLTHEYHAAQADMPNVRVVFLKPDDAEAIAKWLPDAKPGETADVPAIHQDPGARLATFANIPDGYAFHGETVHFPAFILLDPQGQEAFRFVGSRTQERFFLAQFKQQFPNLAPGK